MKKLILLFLSVFVYTLQIDCNKADEEIKEISITTNSKEALNHFIKGRDLWENMHIPEAALILDSAVMKDSSFAMAYYYLAYSQSDLTKLLEYYNKAKSHVDKISEGEKLFILGINEELNNRYDEAREIYKKLVVLFPGDKRAHGQLAWHYYRRGEFQSAINSYKKAIEIDPNFAPTYNMIGYCYSNLDNFNEAEIALKKYSELMPDEANPHDSYAEILMKQGKFDESIKEYQKALSIDPNLSASFLGLGTDFIFKGNYEKGREQFQKLLDAPYDDGYRTIAYESLAYSYIFENKYHDAINELQKAYDLAKMNEDFIYYDWTLEKGISYYMFSDGYVDQFGGPKGRKFMKKNFKRLILDIQDYPMNKQKDILEKNLKEWMGNLPQVDDILVMGMRIIMNNDKFTMNKGN